MARLGQGAHDFVTSDASCPAQCDDVLFYRHADYATQAIDGVLQRMKMEAWGSELVLDDDEQTPAEPSGPVVLSRAEAIRVFLLDDNDVVRDAVLDRLGEEGDIEVVGACAGATEAIRLVLGQRPDVAVLDYHLRDGDGLSVCEHIRSVDASIKVLLLTAAADPDLVHAARMAGASGYLVKKIRGLDLAGAVRKVADGQLVFPSDLSCSSLGS